MRFSGRAHHHAAHNALTLALAEARARGPVLDLTVSNPTSVGLPELPREALLELASPEVLRYCPDPLGSRDAREAVARDHAGRGHPVDPSRIALTASTSEAYSWLFKILADPGDEILVPRPSYPLLEWLAVLESVRLVPYPLRYDGAWHIDMHALRARVGPRTRALILVSPNNPTGSYTRRDELSALLDLGVPIVSDEVFATYPLTIDAGQATSALGASRGLVFALSGLSKLAGLPQVKLGWIAVDGDPALVSQALSRLELVADTFLSVGTPVQHAAPALLASSRIVTDAIRARIRSNLAVLDDALGPDSPATRLSVCGGWSAILRLPRTRSEEEWLVELLEKDAVYTHPGYFFDFEDEPFAVLSLLGEEADFAEGARRIARRVASG